jgi:hypothetical protein
MGLSMRTTVSLPLQKKTNIQIDNIITELGGMNSDSDFDYSDESSASNGEGEQRGIVEFYTNN